MVAISYGKGVMICQQYDKMNGEYFKQFVTQTFYDMFIKCGNKDGRLFIQDGDPSQNSKLTKEAMKSCGAELLKIPPQSPDINQIEKLFHLLSTGLEKQA